MYNALDPFLPTTYTAIFSISVSQNPTSAIEFELSLLINTLKHQDLPSSKHDINVELLMYSSSIADSKRQIHCSMCPSATQFPSGPPYHLSLVEKKTKTWFP